LDVWSFFQDYKLLCFEHCRETPGTVFYVILILDADILAFCVGIPLGGCAWYFGPRGLGTVAIALCGASLAVSFVRILIGINLSNVMTP
jgi:hypothetical protein